MLHKDYYNHGVMDTLSPEKRSEIMSAVRSKNTKAELLVRSYLWSHGIRYRIHYKYLPGKPDIAIPRYKLAIFIHGCFWHGHDGCQRGRLPKSRLEYWEPKIKANKSRDCRIEEELAEIGWRQLVIWECQLRTQKAASNTLPEILNQIFSMRLDGLSK
jgi:DNA mismatch endonuclease (patch repair protein)